MTGDNKQLLYSIEVYSDPLEECFSFNLNVNENYHKAVLQNGCSINSIVISLMFAFLFSYCESSFIDFDEALEEAIKDYLANESVDLNWSSED